MFYPIKKRNFLILLTAIFCFSACQNTTTIDNSERGEEQTELISISPSLEAIDKESNDDISSEISSNEPFDAYLPPSYNENVWNVNDVDTDYIDPNRKLIAFTFDDSPSRHSENLLSVFASYNEHNPDCKATATLFFNGGKFDLDTEHVLHTACVLGMELGNHTHSHLDLTTLDEETLRKEIEQTDRLLKKADDLPYHLFRAPYGKINETVKNVVATPIIDWTIDTLDWTGVSEDSIYRTVFDNKFSGAIVLMHDGYPHTVDALKRLLPDLKAEGYQVVSVSAMAKTHGCTLQRGKVYIRARKQQK